MLQSAEQLAFAEEAGGKMGTMIQATRAMLVGKAKEQAKEIKARTRYKPKVLSAQSYTIPHGEDRMREVSMSPRMVESEARFATAKHFRETRSLKARKMLRRVGGHMKAMAGEFNTIVDLAGGATEHYMARKGEPPTMRRRRQPGA